MAESLGVLTLLPPLIAIAVAIYTKEVIIALLSGLLVSELLLAGGHWQGLFAVIERPVFVLTDAGNARLMTFCLLIGVLVGWVRSSGGVSAFVHKLTTNGWVDTPRKASLMTFLVGVVIFVESNLSALASGLASRSLFDRFGLSRARLAYLIDSTCAPVSILFVFNGWGAYVMALLRNNGVDSDFQTFIATIPYNFYALLALLLALYTAWTTRVFGALNRHEQKRIEETMANEPEATKVIYFVIPIVTMVLSVPWMMWWTGHGNLMQGSGSQSILYATAIACLVAYVLLRWDGQLTHTKLMQEGFSGMKELLPLVVVLILGIALGASIRDLGTGAFIASWVGPNLPTSWVAPVIFMSAALVAFTTGTSWGTFAIMVPIAIPVALQTGMPLPIAIGAALSGGIFGDHTSPISDTTIIASLAAGTDVMTHVRTQLPYALFAALLSILGFWLAS